MFIFCTSFSPDLRRWNLSAVLKKAAVLEEADSFNPAYLPPALHGWDASELQARKPLEHDAVVQMVLCDLLTR
jgi:hypothetical protein